MYLLDVCGVEYVRTYIRRECKLIAFDIKHLTDIKLIFYKTISAKDFPQFGSRCYTMLIVGHTIQFVLGGNTIDKKNRIYHDDTKWMHYEFDITTHKLTLIHKNIHIAIGEKNRATRSKLLHFVENLEIGDWVDVQDSMKTFYLAKILDIKDKKFAIGDDNYNMNDDDELVPGKVRSMKIRIHYSGWSDKYDEWINIDVTNGDHDTGDVKKSDMSTTDYDEMKKYADINCITVTSLCDCNDKCLLSYYAKEKSFANLNYHRLTLPKTQSMMVKPLDGLSAVYSKTEKKIIILGSNNRSLESIRGSRRRSLWRGVYCKRICRDKVYKDYKLIVDGFIHQFETIAHAMMDNYNYNYNIFVNIPKDINEMILKYYFIPDDHDWTQAIKKDKKGKFMANMFGDHFYVDSGCVMVNNDRDIFIFGGTNRYDKIRRILKLDIETNILRRLTNIECPSASTWYPVFCKKSQNIHLFSTSFDNHWSISLQTLNNATSVVLDE